MLEKISDELYFRYGFRISKRIRILLVVLLAGALVNVVLYFVTKPKNPVIPKEMLLKMQMMSQPVAK